MDGYIRCVFQLVYSYTDGYMVITWGSCSHRSRYSLAGNPIFVVTDAAILSIAQNRAAQGPSLASKRRWPYLAAACRLPQVTALTRIRLKGASAR